MVGSRIQPRVNISARSGLVVAYEAPEPRHTRVAFDPRGGRIHRPGAVVVCCPAGPHIGEERRLAVHRLCVLGLQDVGDSLRGKTAQHLVEVWDDGGAAVGHRGGHQGGVFGARDVFFLLCVCVRMIDFESVFCVSPIQIVWGFPPYVLYGQTFVNFQKLTGGGKSTLVLKGHF